MNTAILHRDEMRSALAITKNVIEKRSTIPILQNIWLSSVNGVATMRATDLDVEISVAMPQTKIMAKDFAVTLPHAALADVEKKAKASDTVAVDVPVYEDPGSRSGAQAILYFGGLKVRLETLNPVDFPKLKEAKFETRFDIDTADFVKALELTQFAMSTEETRYYLNGVYMCQEDDGQRLVFVSTDGHRLAYHAVSGVAGIEKMPGVIIPRGTVATLTKLLKGKGAPETIHIAISHGGIMTTFSYGNVTIDAKMIDGTFPLYGNVIPRDNPGRASLDVAAVTEAIKAVSAISNERAKAIKLRFSRSAGLTVSVNNYDLGSAEMTVPCTYLGDDYEVGFNAKYLLEIMSHLDSTHCTLELPVVSEATGPVIIRGDDTANTFYVQMPMRV